jgi:membrane-associated phospholipid phosphatase
MPNFPAYPSNHACASGAAAFVLGALWPNESRRLGEMANEAGLSRVYGGIHFRFDSDTGLAMARSIGALAAESDRRNAVLDLLR